MPKVRFALAWVGLSVLLVLMFGEPFGGGQASDSSPEPLEEANPVDELNSPVTPDTTPRSVSVGAVRHVDPSMLPPWTPEAPQEAPLPHAEKTPSGQPGRPADAVLQAPDAPGAAPTDTSPAGAP